ncbi:MAG: DUF1127 domain-containing protein [Alphaproteobacteria bacterium]
MTTDTLHLHPTPAAAHRAVRLPLGWLAAGIDAWMSWLERREQMRLLQAMDDLQLKDIGITRTDVLRELKGRSSPYY